MPARYACAIVAAVWLAAPGSEVRDDRPALVVDGKPRALAGLALGSAMHLHERASMDVPHTREEFVDRRHA